MNIKKSLRALAALSLLAAAASPWQFAQAAPAAVRCSGTLAKVSAINLPAQRIVDRDFAGGGGIPAGTFDAKPVLSQSVTTTVATDSATSCLIATLSTLPMPNDNHVVFQVRVDGVPMTGHDNNLFGFGTPAVSDPNLSDTIAVEPPRMASYTFYAPVTPGRHTVEVMGAGCCSGTSGSDGSYVNAATLVLQYR